jgi:citrate lyase subunit beta/citryl-CoA lyase
MIETPTALFNIRALAAEAEDSESRLAGFVIGTNDLAKETRARIVPGRAPMLPWLASCVLAAHAYGIDVLDGVYNDIADTEGFAAECAQGRDMGFDGKTLIHPSQIVPCNTAFSPSAEETVQARETIAAFDRPENKGKGVVQIGGRMVERMHADIARRTVAIVEAIEKTGVS